MSYQFGWFSWVMFATCVLGMCIALGVKRRQWAPGMNYLLWLTLALSVWAFGGAFEAAATTPSLKQTWSQILYVGTVGSPLLYFLFAMTYSRHDKHLTPRRIGALVCLALITMVVTATNQWHHWLWTEITIDSVTNVGSYGHGWYFWIVIAYAYGLCVIASLALFTLVLQTSKLYRAQIAALLMGAAFPLLGNAIYVFFPSLLRGLDWTPLFFLASCTALARSMSLTQGLGLNPVARDRVVDTMRDAVIVIDSRMRVGDMNLAMETLAGVDGRHAVGRPLADVLSEVPGLAQALKQIGDTSSEFHVAGENGGRCFDLQRSPLFDQHGILAAEIFVLRDITLRKQLEEERAELLLGLQEAVAHVKTLSGLLPICANCKRIRDDQGYWHGVEAYLEAHSDTEFTHGICPECMKKLYPEYVRPADRREGKTT